jgi:hypothetical protein
MKEPPAPLVFALGPFSIEGAPPMDDLVLLFCPEQGGWLTEVRFAGRWLAHISTEIVPRPTHLLTALPIRRANVPSLSRTRTSGR